MLADLMLGGEGIIGGIKRNNFTYEFKHEEKGGWIILFSGFFTCLRFSINKKFYKLRPYYKLNTYVDVYSQIQ